MRSPVVSSGTVTMRFMTDVRALGAPFSVMTSSGSAGSDVAWCQSRPSSASPERMVLLSALIAAGSVAAGLGISTQLDVPGGPAIVLVMAFAALFSLTASSLRGTR